MTSDRAPNRLANETSPYLLQHQYNPVDWYPWGEEAFAKARAENKPLLISIGYSACHWCHVMERECFENEAIAKIINETVVPVKVDREERPDVDTIYMNACQAMTGQGGWPLNAFVTPSLKPFFVGTYFPPTDNYGRPGFPSVLNSIRKAWVTESSDLVLQAENLHRQLDHFQSSRPSEPLDQNLVELAVRDAGRTYDLKYGGFGTAPKFPPDTRLALLIEGYRQNGAEAALQMTEGTLKAMARGGLYDHIGGGFTRYSVDAQWMIPHFEKMLYNQALLIPVYADAYLETGNDFYATVIRETIDWVLRDLTDPSGAFMSAYDADSEGEEGKFYVWTPAELATVLPDDAERKLFSAYYNITERGNFEHRTTNPHVTADLATVASGVGIAEEDAKRLLASARQTVWAHRETRVKPGLDDKCITAWNGLMISALCKAYQVLGDDRDLAAAQRAADFLLDNQWRNPRLLRIFGRGQSRIQGMLDDYSFFANALLDCYETTFDVRYITASGEILQAMLERFGDPTSGALYFTGDDDKTLISRTRDSHDSALPSSAAIGAQALLRYGHLRHDEKMVRAGRRVIETEASGANSHPAAFGSLILAGRYTRNDFVRVEIYGEDGAGALTRAAWNSCDIPRVIAKPQPGEPALAAPMAGGEPAAVVCREVTCEAPITSPDELRKRLTRAKQVN